MAPLQAGAPDARLFPASALSTIPLSGRLVDHTGGTGVRKDPAAVLATVREADALGDAHRAVPPIRLPWKAREDTTS